jgi:hypothetical protein
MNSTFHTKNETAAIMCGARGAVNSPAGTTAGLDDRSLAVMRVR